MSEPKRISDLNELHPLVKQQAEMLLELCKQNGLNAKIIETYRTQERQDYLYAQGRTRPGQIVTWTRSSNHTSKKAFDLIQNKVGDEYNHSFLSKVGKLAKEIGLDWGGDWQQQDMPHFENQKLNPIPQQTVPPKPQEVSTWAKDAVTFCEKKGFIRGDERGFRPKDDVTREELACIVHRVYSDLIREFEVRSEKCTKV